MPITIDTSELNELDYKKLSNWLLQNPNLDQDLWLSLITSGLFVQATSLPKIVTERFLILFNRKLSGTQIIRDEPFAQFLQHFLNNQTASLNTIPEQVATFVLKNQITIKTLFNNTDDFVNKTLENVKCSINDDATFVTLSRILAELQQPPKPKSSIPPAPARSTPTSTTAVAVAPAAVPHILGFTPPKPHANPNYRPLLLIAAISVIAIALTGYGLIALVGLSVALGLLAATGAGITTGCLGYGLFRCSQAPDADLPGNPPVQQFA